MTKKKDLKGGLEQGGDSLGDLAPVTAKTATSSDAKAPEKAPVTLPKRLNIKAGLKKAKQLVKDAQAVREWVVNDALPSLVEYGTMDAASRETVNPDSGRTFKEDARAMQDLLDRYLRGMEGQEYVEAAYMGWYLYHLQRPLPDRDQLHAMFDNMIRQGRLLLVTDENAEADLPGGKVKDGKRWATIDGRRFNFVAKAGITPADLETLRAAFKGLNQQIWDSTKAKWETDAADLEKGANISYADAVINGAEGYYVIRVPSQPPQKPGDSPLEGGTVLFKQANGFSKIIGVANDSHGWGNFSRRLLQAKDDRIVFRITSLSYPNPPPVPLLMSKGLALEDAKRIQMIWHVHNRAGLQDPEVKPFLEQERAKKHPGKSREEQPSAPADNKGSDAAPVTAPATTS